MSNLSLKTRYFFLLILFFPLTIVHAGEIIKSGAQYSFFKGRQNPSSSTDWAQYSFNDQAWVSGATPFWYGDGVNGTQLTDMQNSYSTVYLRKKININSLSNIDKVSLFINYDDGFNLYVNGQLLISENAPIAPVYNSFATAQHEFGDFENFIFTVDASKLVAGDNIIAVQVFNASLNSSDVHFDMSLNLTEKKPDLPRTSEVEFDKTGGFYSSAFNVTITAKNSGDKVRYTLDCSDPESSSTAVETTSPAIVNINPESTVNRPKTPAVILRACAINTTLAPSFSRTASYIYTEKVKQQTYPGGEWPKTPVNTQIFDYEMDPDIVNSTVYASQMDKALTDIPTLSLVTTTPNLVDPAYGIYVNAGVRGEDWERAGSLELFDKEGNQPGFQVNSGIRIRGGWSRHPDNPKHAFRLFFRSEYGNSKLNYPLFGDEGTDEFDKIDLRTPQNYSWSYKGDKYCTMNRDVFSRDLQREMNQPYTRSRYYHLYLNGLYWGIYQTQERAEANFAEYYFGGDKTEYDVTKVDTQNYNTRTIEATDGDLTKWNELYQLYLKGFAKNSDYYNVQGMNEFGQIDTTKEVLVNIDNLIDYMLVIFYTGNTDAPFSEFSGSINNFFNIRNRNFKRQGFQFLTHDSEHSMQAYPVTNNAGPTENRVSKIINATTLDMFQAQSLHNKLSENALYRSRFADRAFKYLYNNGVLSVDKCKALFMSRANEIQNAIIAESARWGDSKVTIPFTKVDWQTAVNDVVTKFIETRTNTLINQLKTVGLLPQLSAPAFAISTAQKQESVSSEKLTFSNNINLVVSNTSGTGTLYITTNGEDPMLQNGVVNPNAISCVQSTYSVTLSHTTDLKARVLANNVWSPLNNLHLVNQQYPIPLIVTEISYNPKSMGANKDKEFEFIELKNTGSNAIDISDVKIAGGISYASNVSTILQPNQFFVIASNPYLFEYKYQLSTKAKYNGHLSNEGDRLILTNKNFDFSDIIQYGISSPWPDSISMVGFTLVPQNIKPLANNSLGENWRRSSVAGGTPFADDLVAGIDIKTNEQIRIFPNPASSYFMLRSDAELSQACLSIFDTNGRKVFTRAGINLIENQDLKIDVRNLNIRSGIYILQIVNKAFLFTQLICINKGN